MRIVAGTTGTPAEPSCLKVRNQKLQILCVAKSISYCYLLCEAATSYVRQPHYVSQPIYVRKPHASLCETASLCEATSLHEIVL